MHSDMSSVIQEYRKFCESQFGNMHQEIFKRFMPSGSTITLLTMQLKYGIGQMCKDIRIKGFITVVAIVTEKY